ncbi:MAG: hypothetical protein J6M39_00580 [Lachnospiraceae bacterium]|nr:hypothetical protein [Lachnospiraceae bacterium]
MKRVILVLFFCLHFSLSCFANTYDLSEINQCKLVTSYSRDTLVDQMDTVRFGSYYQNSSDVKEPIEWIVLDRKGNEAFLLSKYILDFKCYNDSLQDFKNVTWAHSTLRQWLNHTFLRSAFDNNEQICIVVSNILNNSNQVYGTDGGNNTSDKIFCLSSEEVIKYFNNPDPYSGETMKGSKFSATRPTNYAISENISTYKNLVNNGTAWHKGNSRYWLRSPGIRASAAAFIGYAGCLWQGGAETNKWIDEYDYNIYPGVRPALWVNISSLDNRDADKDKGAIVPVVPGNPGLDEEEDLEDSLKEKQPEPDSWYKTKGGSWYYYESDRTTRKKGWFVDPTDGQTYYLKPSSGKMVVGWTKIDGSKYYFNEFHDNSDNWYDDGDGWYKSRNKKVKAYGSMFRNEMTPDGKWVDENGKLID